MAFHVESSRVAFTRRYTAMPYNAAMYSIIETAVFQRYAAEIWQDAEREAFIVWLANNPLAGAVIPGSGGLRKVRWTTPGKGKRGGARVIYYNILEDGEIWLLIAYSKAKFDNLPTAFLNQLREAIQHG
jgi:hypothetical protein